MVKFFPSGLARNHPLGPRVGPGVVQGRRNTRIFLTPNITPLTFLQGFHEEIYKEDYTKPIEYA